MHHVSQQKKWNGDLQHKTKKLEVCNHMPVFRSEFYASFSKRQPTSPLSVCPQVNLTSAREARKRVGVPGFSVGIKVQVSTGFDIFPSILQNVKRPI